MLYSAVDYSPGMPLSIAITAVVAGMLLGKNVRWWAMADENHGQTTRQALLLAQASLCGALVISSMQYATARSHELRIRDLTASILAGTDHHAATLAELAAEVERVNARCRRIPASKDMLLALAHAQVLLAPTLGNHHLQRADRLLRQVQSVGAFRVDQAPTQSSIRDRMATGTPQR
jgi:hypothetical protein